jgi:ankyrin repeat protein
MDVNARDLCGMTPLHWAVRVPNLSKQDEVLRVILYLLDKGAKVNSKDNYGFTPLHRCRLPKVAAYLIERGAGKILHFSCYFESCYNLGSIHLYDSGHYDFDFINIVFYIRPDLVTSSLFVKNRFFLS